VSPALFALWGQLLAAAPLAQLAVVVGNNHGDANEVALHHAVADARRMGEVLGDVANAHVVLLEEPSAAELERLLDGLGQGRQGEPATTLTFYYAGHADLASMHLRDGHYPLTQLQTQLEASGAKVVVVVLDACRTDGGMRERGLAPVAGPDISLVASEQPTGVVWIRSTSQGEGAQESEQLQGGVFTHFWISALRGSADQDGDGAITLAEAYAYAATRTYGYSTAASGQSQQPTYDIKLEGARELVLGRTTAAPSLVLLPASRATQYLIRRLPSDAVLLTLEAREDRPVRVGLPAGRFQILKRQEQRLWQAEVAIPWGGEQVVQPADFTALSVSSVGLRGALPEPPARLSGELLGGVALEPDFPLSWQQLTAAVALRLPVPYERWQLAASLGWQARRFDLVTSDASVRAHALRLGVGAQGLFELGAVTVPAGPELRADTVFQRRQLAPSERYRAAGISSPPVKTALRLGVMLKVGVRVPVRGAFAWTANVSAGAMGQRVQGGATRVTPIVEVATGPGLSW
jgi:hypothetical protein